VEPKWLQNGWSVAMPTTLTLKNVPDDVYDRLKWSAETHRRSINNEAILCLEAVLVPARVSPDERLARARALRAKLNATFKAKDIDKLKRAGRA
jgi:plasmid stability protein